MMTRWLKVSLVGCVSVLLAACGGHHKKPERDPLPFHTDRPADVMYRQAEHQLAMGYYSSAVKTFEKIQVTYPYHEESEHVAKDLIYAYYKKDDMPGTVASADKFIHLYPTSQYVPYAYYMRGMANFKQDRGLLSKLIPVNVTKRAPGTMKDAFNDFKVVVTEYPDSIYAKDARQHMVYLRNFFAQQEINTAEFYMDRKAYVAAINRANYVLAHFSHAPQTRLARDILVKAYTKLDMPEMASKSKGLS